jgi:hypothetical protein
VVLSLRPAQPGQRRPGRLAVGEQNAPNQPGLADGPYRATEIGELRGYERDLAMVLSEQDVADLDYRDVPPELQQIRGPCRWPIRDPIYRPAGQLVAELD